MGESDDPNAAAKHGVLALGEESLVGMQSAAQGREVSGQCLGPYELLEAIGLGCVGTRLMVQQPNPVGRRS